MNMTKSRTAVGIIGITGRMGKLLAETLNSSDNYQVKYGFARNHAKDVGQDYQLLPQLSELFANSEYIVDFSTATLVSELLRTAVSLEKPLVICTTGWQREGEQQALLEQLCQKVPVVIAPNTSLGACLQRFLAIKMASALPLDYDIDIHEKHHRHKIDIPSGTATALAQAIVDEQLRQHAVQYDFGELKAGARPDNYIGMSVQRSGQLPGEHEISFTNDVEMLSLKHISFSRQLFAKGVIPILDWLRQQQPVPGCYTMFDVLGLV